MPTPGRIPRMGEHVDRVAVKDVAHEVEVVNAHVFDEHERLRDVMAAGAICPIHEEGNNNLFGFADDSFVNETAGGAGHLAEAVVLAIM